MKIRTIAEFLRRLAKTKKRNWMNTGCIRAMDRHWTCPVLAACGMKGSYIWHAFDIINEPLARKIACASDQRTGISPSTLRLRRRILRTLGLKETT